MDYWNRQQSRTKAHKLLLDQIKPYPFNTEGSKEVYVKIINFPTQRNEDIKDNNYNENGSSEDDVIHISLMNENMLDYDAAFFENENREEYYRPYFYEFYVHSKYIKGEILSFLSENQGNWMVGKFSINEQSKEDGYIFEGNVFFSASPFQTKKCSIFITNKAVPSKITSKYLRTYDISKSVVSVDSSKYSTMCEILDTTMASNDYFTRIYNVGQGNCMYIRTIKEKRILFDIGYNKNPGSSDWSDSNIVRSKLSITHMKPHLNILSHWDMDHIIGVAFAQDHMFDHPWIAPDINELSSVSAGAARLAKYLSWKGQLYLVDNKFLGDLVHCGTGFKLWRGQGLNNTGARNHGLNKANNFGLIIELIGDKRMLLPGDCEYRMLPPMLNFSTTRYNYLIVPHHCSRMELIPLVASTRYDDYAIISVGQNQYKPEHPYDVHKNHLQYVDYNLEETVNKWSIDIPTISGDTQGVLIR